MNDFIAQKKELGDAQAGKNALLAGSAAPDTQNLQGEGLLRPPPLIRSYLPPPQTITRVQEGVKGGSL